MLELLTSTTLDLSRSAARHGTGLFETIRVEDGRPLRLGLHLERLARGLTFLGMDEVPDARRVGDFLQNETSVGSLGVGVLRLVAVDDRLMAWAEPLPEEPAGPVKVAIESSFRRSSTSPLNRHKTLAYLENNLLARRAREMGVYELLALNEHDRLTDGSRTTVLVQMDRTWVTPPVEEGALPGTLRALLLEACLVREETVSLKDLRRARAMLLANALRELVPVTELAGLEGGHGLDPDPRALRDLQAAVAASKQ